MAESPERWRPRLACAAVALGLAVGACSDYGGAAQPVTSASTAQTDGSASTAPTAGGTADGGAGGSTRLTSPAQPGADASITGTITYRERIALSPDAVLVVELSDVTYLDAASVLIAEQIIASPGQVPIDYELRYLSDDIDERRRYSVSARIIEGDGRLAFINDWAYDVITQGNPHRVDMTLVMVEPPPDGAP